MTNIIKTFVLGVDLHYIGENYFITYGDVNPFMSQGKLVLTRGRVFVWDNMMAVNLDNMPKNIISATKEVCYYDKPLLMIPKNVYKNVQSITILVDNNGEPIYETLGGLNFIIPLNISLIEQN